VAAARCRQCVVQDCGTQSSTVQLLYWDAMLQVPVTCRSLYVVLRATAELPKLCLGACCVSNRCGWTEPLQLRSQGGSCVPALNSLHKQCCCCCCFRDDALLELANAYADIDAMQVRGALRGLFDCCAALFFILSLSTCSTYSQRQMHMCCPATTASNAAADMLRAAAAKGTRAAAVKGTTAAQMQLSTRRQHKEKTLTSMLSNVSCRRR
jgi:hypothetical protein